VKAGLETLYYVHDPMCSWCWAFRPVWLDIQAQLPASITVKYLLGGLAPDSDAPMPAAMQAAIRDHWQEIQLRVPGTVFNFDFWRLCSPRRSTYPACRAVIAARKQDALQEDAMIRAIQEAYYLQARNPSDDDVLVELAASLALDTDQFYRDISAPETQRILERDIRFCQGMGVTGFPSLVLRQGAKFQHIAIAYNDINVVLQQV